MIRDAVEADAKSISEIYNYYIRNTVITFEEHDVSAEEISRRIAKVQSNGLWWLVIEVDNAIAGYAYCSKWRERSALHERFNMKKVARFEEVGYKFSQWVDVGYWQLTKGLTRG